MKDLKILFVDDEEKILLALKRELLFFSEEKNLTMLFANSANNALKILEKEYKKVAVIISDQKMPGIKGSEFLLKVKALYPDMSAYRFQQESGGRLSRFPLNPAVDPCFLL